MIINGLLALFSFVLIAFGVIGMVEANSNCKGDDCSSWASGGIIVLGIFGDSAAPCLREL